MKVALINSVMPFIKGGAEIVVDDLEKELIKRGHQIDKFGIPYSNKIEEHLISLIMVSQMIRLDEYDVVISFKFPAYCVRHRNKVLWIFHQFRQVYELFDKEYGFVDSPKSRGIQSIIKNCDNKYINDAKKAFAISESAKRLKYYNNINAEVLDCYYEAEFIIESDVKEIEMDEKSYKYRVDHEINWDKTIERLLS